MKKIFKKLTLCILPVFLAALVFNIPLKTRQGINGVVFTRNIPLYAKLSGFFYRDYQYKDLSGRIVNGIEGDIGKIEALYGWTVKNIRKRPEDFPVVDDHIWDIIVRGYGGFDQMADVFTTLASYAGYDAFWNVLRINGVRGGLILSFVKIGDKWHVFDIRGKKPFMTAENLKLSTVYGPTYEEYMNTMEKGIFEIYIKRPDKQKIFPRIVNEIRKMFFPKGT